MTSHPKLVLIVPVSPALTGVIRNRTYAKVARPAIQWATLTGPNAAAAAAGIQMAQAIKS